MLSRRFFAAVAAVASILAPHALAIGFTDVDGSPYEEAIIALAEEGIIGGYPDGSTKPQHALNRAEALKVAVLAQRQFAQELTDTQRNMPTIPLFSDVVQESWYAVYLEVAFSNKVITGYPDNLFRPYRGLTTEEAIVIVLRAFKDPGQAAFQSSDDVDNVPGQWFTPYLSSAIAKDLIQPGSKLRVGTLISRGQFFSLVYRMRKQAPIVPVLSVPAQSSSSAPSANVWVNPRPTQPATSLPASASSSSRSVGPVVTGVVDPLTAMRFASSKEFAISIPSLGITDLAVFHPEDTSTQEGVLKPLSKGVGHLFAYPGEGSKVLIYGHSSGYPWDLSLYTKIFRTINKVKIGQRIYVTYKDRLYVYEVTEKKSVPVKDIEAFEPDESGEELILYTCWPPDSTQERFLVHALPIDTVALQ